MTTTRRTALCLAATCVGASASLAACSSDPATEIRVPMAEIPQDGGLVKDQVVLTQPIPGEFKAFDVRCPHQGCAVNRVTTESIVCPCHGSQFALADGSVVSGPATEGLTERTATIDGTDVVVS